MRLHKTLHTKRLSRLFEDILTPNESFNMSPAKDQLWSIKDVSPMNYRHSNFGDQNGVPRGWIFTDFTKIPPIFILKSSKLIALFVNPQEGFI